MGYGVTLLCTGVVSCFRPEMLKAACIQIVDNILSNSYYHFLPHRSINNCNAGLPNTVFSESTDNRRIPFLSCTVYKYFVVGTVLFFAAFLSFYAGYSHSEAWISGIFGSGWKAFGLLICKAQAISIACKTADNLFRSFMIISFPTHIIISFHCQFRLEAGKTGKFFGQKLFPKRISAFDAALDA